MTKIKELNHSFSAIPIFKNFYDREYGYNDVYYTVDFIDCRFLNFHRYHLS